MTIPFIGEQDDSVGEAGIEFGESEHDLISVSRIDNDVEFHLRAAEPFSQRHSSALQKFNDRDAFVGNAGAPVIGNRHTLAW